MAPKFSNFEQHLIHAVRGIMDETNIKGEVLTLNYVDFKKPYPHVCNLKVYTLPPNKMMIAYYEDNGNLEEFEKAKKPRERRKPYEQITS